MPFLLPLVVVFTAACGGGGTSTPTVAPSTSTTAPATTTSAAAVVTTTRPISTTTTSACLSTPMPTNAAGVTTAAGNFDGDGRPDVLKAYQAAGAWHLRTELSAGGAVDVAVPDVGTGESVKAIGGFNLDSGVDEAFATVGSGAYTTHVGIWKMGSCQLTRLTVDGQPSTFPVGASVRNQVGVRCVAGTAVQVFQSQSSDGITYTGTIANYDVVGNTLVLANTSPPQVLTNDDPALRPYSAFTCGSLSLP